MLRSAIVLIACSALLACESSTEPEPAGDKPWDELITFGHFRINGAPVVTNEESASMDRLVDGVLVASLPNVDFQSFSLNVYVPTDDAVIDGLSNVQIVVTRTDGTRSGDIFTQGAYLEEVTLAGQLYSVYSITGQYSVAPAVGRTNFASIAFSFNVFYENANDAVLDSRAVVIEVHKRP